MNNLPIKREKGFMGRIKNFFKRLFCSNNNIHIEKVNDNNSIEDSFNEIKDKNLNHLKVKVDEDLIKKIELESKREEFLDEVYKNPKLLDELSIEKLKIIDKYYDISINNYKQKIQNAN